MNRKLLLALIALLLVCICVVVTGGAGMLIYLSRDAFVFAPPTATRISVYPPAAPAPGVSTETADALLRTQIPPRDVYQIVPRLKKNPVWLTPVPTPAPRARQVGDRDTFYVMEDAFAGRYRTATATLQLVMPHAYFWVEDGLRFEQAALQKAADFFERSTYPTNHNYFGSEKSPGVDGDSHVNILNARLDQYLAGYFSSEDTYPRTFAPFSNQRNIIYMSIEGLGSDNYNSSLAHEFQHMIHNYQARYKAGWIDEGLANLAIKVNGLQVNGTVDTFARHPDTQLNTWADEPQATYAHYGASYLFFTYVAQRFGPDFIREVIHAPREGIYGIQTVLDQRAGGLKFDDLFADWAAANYLNDPTVENGRYAYPDEKSFRITSTPTLSQYPMTRTTRLSQYAANYFTLQSANTDVTIYFTGTTTTRLLPADAHSGRWMWYSNRGDLSNMNLTREADLTRVSKATLKFWTWYDIEKGFDYAYVQVSADGGKTWDILPGRYTTTSNPNGASYGHAYTGRSGVTDDKSKAPAQWVQEQVDLTSYAGKRILLRFEYITDDMYNAPSFAVDDIAIPEIGFSDDVEGGGSGWQANGFVRVDNVLPQRYMVQVIQVGAPTRVARIPLDNQNRGSFTITGFGKDVSRAILIVTAHAPVTTEPTEYQFAIVPK